MISGLLEPVVAHSTAHICRRALLSGPIQASVSDTWPGALGRRTQLGAFIDERVLYHARLYAATVSRISVRVFGGWDFADDEVERPAFAERNYVADRQWTVNELRPSLQRSKTSAPQIQAAPMP